MPVVFMVDPNLPKDINTIALSYTFFEMPGGAIPAAAQAPTGNLDLPSSVTQSAKPPG